MRVVVAKEVRILLFKYVDNTMRWSSTRSDVTLRAVYNGLIFLNQIEYTADDVEFVEEQIKFFLSVFKKYVAVDTSLDEEYKEIMKLESKEKKKALKKYHLKKESNKEMESQKVKLLSALLSGINRALPFSKSMNYAAKVIE